MDYSIMTWITLLMFLLGALLVLSARRLSESAVDVLARVIGKNVRLSLAALTLASIALISRAYSEFYSQLNVAPADVGVHLDDIIRSSGSGLFIFISVTAIFSGLIALPLSFIDRWQPGAIIARVLRKRHPTSEKWDRTSLILWGYICVIPAIMSAIWIFIQYQQGIADQVRYGIAVHSVGIWGFPIVEVRADYVKIDDVDPTKPYQLGLNRSHCLMYLGSSDGMSVIYDANTESPTRIPNALITTTVVQMPAACKALNHK